MGDVLAGLIVTAICFPIGWPIVKLVTLGKYPSRGSWFASTAQAQWTTMTGFTFLIIAMMFALKQFDVF
ncbi:hypothetical protein CCU68_31880 [Pseudomonas gingeri NCPPB 3146 = LMG 5327]|uniref:Uncharacterized protein n=1 Tax=Pseudomonas gingeri NCPPB 3146 = LMG 5327 TaxID=707248 RepID=A0ABX4XTJ9_9PSED|nr:hypothetical protein [Pseudomonas gingeri]PNQ88460.1 hypothetical protein CCU68_31880 [Pseudomonas gingeri NCPPB 3146 = LMG 5327]